MARDQIRDQGHLSRSARSHTGTYFDWSGHLRCDRRVDTGDRAWSGVGLSRTFEHGVVTDPAPSAAQVIVDGDEFEGGATVGAGE